jgi:hypothetical protein
MRRLPRCLFGEWIVIIAIVLLAVVAAVIVGRYMSRRKRTQRLKERFGPEYERAVGEAGEPKAGEHELIARERMREKLDIIPLSVHAAQQYAARWQTVQTAFVDNPSSAVRDADRLVIEVMRERGYPIDDFDQRAADISVDHPQVVENYRAAHHICLTGQEREIGTEEQRQAFVHYRALFEELLETDKDLDMRKGSHKSQERSA